MFPDAVRSKVVEEAPWLFPNNLIEANYMNTGTWLLARVIRVTLQVYLHNGVNNRKSKRQRPVCELRYDDSGDTEMNVVVVRTREAAQEAATAAGGIVS